MGWVAGQVVDSRTGEGWRGMRSGGRGPAGGGLAGDTRTWQAQIPRVRNTCAYWVLFLLPSLTKVSDEPQQQVVAVRGDDGSGQSWG